MSKKLTWFRGIFPALVTPFTADDKLDEAAYRALIRYVLPHVNGVLPSGTTGEFSSMSFAEKQRSIEIALDEVAGKVPVIAGTGCPSTMETLALTRWAKDAGAAAALVVSPYYLKPAFNEVYDHFKAVNEIGVPIILYNIPQCMGTHLQWWTAEGMALDFENVVGIKDSSGDMPFHMALLEKLYGQISIVCGHDEIAGATMLAGGDGAILASANLIPEIWQEIFQASQRGDMEFVQRRQRQIQILVRIIARKGGPQAVKEGLRMLGLPMSDGRHPFMPGDAFEREDYEDMRTQLENLGKIPKQEKVFPLNGGVKSQYAVTTETPATLGNLTLRVGEGFCGPPFSELAHIDLLLGKVDGPVGRAIERALGEARPGHEVVVINERPRTLLVPTVTTRTKAQKELVYEWAAQGVKLAIEHSLSQGFIPDAGADDLCMIANVFVHPAASIKRRVRINNYKAMRGAIRKAVEGRPTLAELVNEKESARHPFKYAP
ncbi:MAG: formaldehyde-activating enzyme [Chloroflexota bacterium]